MSCRRLGRDLPGGRMKALIHIGIPKSGTSSIQAFLSRNRASLAGQGVLYAPFNPDFGSQFELPVTALEACGDRIVPELERRRLGLVTRAHQAAYVAEYDSYLSGVLRSTKCDLFIGSSEHIHAWLISPAHILALDRFLSARFTQVRYLVYLRAQDELVVSGYSEAIRRGATHDFQTHLLRHGRQSHWSSVRQWRGGVGSRLLVRLTCADALKGGDLLTDFCSIAGIDAANLDRPPRVNAALSRGEIALRRRLNRVLPVLGRDGRLHPVYQLALHSMAPLARRYPERIGLSDAERAEVLEQNRGDNEKIRKRYFKDRPALF